MRRPFLFAFLSLSLLSMTAPAVAQNGGRALHFDNSDYTTGGDFVYFPHHDFGIGDELTVAAWVYWNSAPDNTISNPHEPSENKWANLVTLDYHDATDQGQFWLQHNSGNTKFEWAIRTSATRTYIQSSTVPQQGRWYFLVGVYDGSPSEGTTSMRLYVDGVQESSANTGVISGNIKAHNGRMRLNFGRIPSDYRLFNGTLDEVRIWKRALTREEIRKQMHSNTTVNPANLVGYYAMNSIAGTTVADSTGTLDGTFYSALVDIHSWGTGLCASIPFTNFTTSSPWKVADGDKDWSSSNFANMPMRTVSGAGIDQTNSVVSNTCNTLTLQYGWGGTAPDTIVTPVLDGQPNDTWFGIEDASQTSQWVVSTAPVYDDWELAATTSPVTVGASGVDLQSTITSTPDSSNNVVVYAHGTASDPPVTGESFPSGITARGAVIWGNAVFGSVTQTLVFGYGGYGGIADPSQVKLLRRATVNDPWTEVPASGLTNSTSARTFTLTGATAGYQYSIGVDQGVNPMPVELTAFRAYRRDNDVELVWETATEINSFSFEVEVREPNGDVPSDDWNIEAVLPAAGNCWSPRHYRWLHANPPSGRLEYRLRMVDRDGSYRYSETFVLAAEIDRVDVALIAYPLPARDMLSLTGRFTQPTPLRVMLVDMTGRSRMLLDEPVTASGTFHWHVALASIHSGIYFLDIQRDGHRSRILLPVVR